MRTPLAVMALASSITIAEACFPHRITPVQRQVPVVVVPAVTAPVAVAEREATAHRTVVENNFIRPAPTSNADAFTDDLVRAMVARLERPKGNLRKFTFANNTPSYVPQRVQRPQTIMSVPQAQGFFYQNVITTDSTQNRVSIVNNIHTE